MIGILAQQRNVLLVSPNYEERSIGWLDCLSDSVAGSTACFVTKLKGANPQEILDEIKDENHRHCAEVLENLGIKHTLKKYKYPLSDFNEYISDILQFASDFSTTCNLIIDVSSLPRSIIYKCLDYLFKHVKDNRIAIGDLVIENIYCIYTPADTYPANGNIDLLGGIKGIYSNKPFHNLVRSSEMVELIMFLSGNAHDASQTMSLTTENGIGPEVRRHILVYLNKANLYSSYLKIGENIGVLKEAARSSDKKSYVFSIEHIGNVLFREADEIFKQHRNFRSGLFVVGSYGPKIISLCAYLAKKRYDLLAVGANGRFNSDVLSSDSAQYVSVYSVGRRESEYYQIDFAKLYGLPPSYV